jgi:hypothetical protein
MDDHIGFDDRLASQSVTALDILGGKSQCAAAANGALQDLNRTPAAAALPSARLPDLHPAGVIFAEQCAGGHTHRPPRVEANKMFHLENYNAS